MIWADIKFDCYAPREGGLGFHDLESAKAALVALQHAIDAAESDLRTACERSGKRIIQLENALWYYDHS